MYAHAPCAFGFPSRRTTGRRSANRGFSLVEVVLALGIFIFAAIPLIGLLGSGLASGKESAQDSNLAQIQRKAAAAAQANPHDSNLPAMFFNYSGEATVAGNQTAVYRLEFTPAPANDAAAGLYARRKWRIAVFSPPEAKDSIHESFVERSREPVEMKNEFP